jgi:molybdopterin synthase sulfur carrier subunit
MKVNFYATLRQIVGKKTLEFDAKENIRVIQLIDLIAQTYPLMRQELLDEKGNLFSHVRVIVNGRDSTFLEGGQEAMISPEDSVSIFPPVGGGQ